jgi:hypothetical protein
LITTDIDFEGKDGSHALYRISSRLLTAIDSVEDSTSEGQRAVTDRPFADGQYPFIKVMVGNRSSTCMFFRSDYRVCTLSEEGEAYGC